MVSPSTTRVTLKVSETEAEIGVSVGDGKDVIIGAGVEDGTGDLLSLLIRPKIKLPKRSDNMAIPKTKFFLPIFTN